MADHFWRQYHDKVLQRRHNITDAGSCEIVTTSSAQSGGARIEVVLPYHHDWPWKARELGGKWRPRTHCWTFKATQALDVCNAIVKIYGQGVLPISWDNFRLTGNEERIQAMKDRLQHRSEE